MVVTLMNFAVSAPVNVYVLAVAPSMFVYTPVDVVARDHR
jgi:hypothetical protein